MRTIRLFVTCLLLLAPAAQGQTPANAEFPPEVVLKAVAVFDRDPLSIEGRAAGAMIYKFAETSPDVVVRIGAPVVPWVGGPATDYPEYRKRLTLAYVVGNVAAQLRTGKKGDLPREGWLQVFRTYAYFKKRTPGLSFFEVDDLQRREEAGTLAAFAEETARVLAGEER